MRKTRWLRGICTLVTALSGLPAFAADHLDKTDDPVHPAEADITDLYVWVDRDKVLLVLNVFPVAGATSKFSDAVQYTFHVESSTEFGLTGQKKDVVCTFDAAQLIDCVLGTPGGTVNDGVAGDASNTTGLQSVTGRLKVFAGLRADPFYFNLEGFNDATAFIKNAGPIPADGAGCLTLDATTATLNVQKLQGTANGMAAAANFFENLNVLSIVLEVDKTLLDGGGPILAVWGSTNTYPAGD